MIIAALLCLALALYCYAISQLQQHGKLKWGDGIFWGDDAWHYKYEFDGYNLVKAPNTWYYRFFDIKYKEAFPLSATLLVSFTDGYHLAQFMFFNFLSLAFTLAIGWDWYLFGGLMVGVRIVHWSARKVFSK